MTEVSLPTREEVRARNKWRLIRVGDLDDAGTMYLTYKAFTVPIVFYPCKPTNSTWRWRMFVGGKSIGEFTTKRQYSGGWGYTDPMRWQRPTIKTIVRNHSISHLVGKIDTIINSYEARASHYIPSHLSQVFFEVFGLRLKYKIVGVPTNGEDWRKRNAKWLLWTVRGLKPKDRD